MSFNQTQRRVEVNNLPATFEELLVQLRQWRDAAFDPDLKTLDYDELAEKVDALLDQYEAAGILPAREEEQHG